MGKLTFPAVLALACLVLAGCQGATVSKKMSLDEFTEFCNDEFAWNQDCDSSSICSSYSSALSQEFVDVKSCVAACNGLDRQLWMANAMTDCEATVGNATDWCEQFCRRKYQK